MEEWAKYCISPAASGEVVALHGVNLDLSEVATEAISIRLSGNVSRSFPRCTIAEENGRKKSRYRADHCQLLDDKIKFPLAKRRQEKVSKGPTSHSGT